LIRLIYARRGGVELEFRILGPLEVYDGVAVVPLTGIRQRALLALLLLRVNEVVSSDRLLEELWGEDQPESGIAALQVRVSQLRKTLGRVGERLETRPSGYLLRVEPGELDLERFCRLVELAAGAEPGPAAEALREALALWRGPALADLVYEPFAQAAVGRLEELRLSALERRIDNDLALGRHADLVAELEALVAEEPWRERLRAQLMLALYRCGRQADALEAYQATRRPLVEQLGLEPSPALRELQRAVLRQDPALELTHLPAPDRSILVAIGDSSRLGPLLALAEQLARRPAKELIFAQPIGEGDELAGTARRLETERRAAVGRGVSARAAVFTSAEPGGDLIRLAVEQDVDLVLIDGGPSPLDDPTIAALLAGAPCDVAVLAGVTGRPGPVLVPFVGAEHDWAAVELGGWVAGAFGIPLLLAGPRDGQPGRDASRLLASASLAVQRSLGVSAEPLLLQPGGEALVAAARDSGLVVLGLSVRWRTDGLGEARRALVDGAPGQVLLVRRGLRPGGLAPRETLTRFTWSIRG
jgi:DNA-binding SARP family transcriptional activator